MKKLFIAMSSMLFAACAPKYPTVTPDEFKLVIAEPDVQLVDVRTQEEYEQGHIVGAMNIDWKSEAFADEAEQMLDKSKTVAVYCRGGRRSHEAGNKLYKMGYKHIVELQGGLEAWKAAGKTVQAEDYECDEFRTSNGKSVKLNALVHASIWIEAGDKQIFVDPVLQLGNRAIDYTTMTPEQVIKVARIIRPKVLFPYHYSDTDLSAIPAELPDIDVRIRHYE